MRKVRIELKIGAVELRILRVGGLDDRAVGKQSVDLLSLVLGIQRRFHDDVADARNREGDDGLTGLEGDVRPGARD